MLQSVLQQAPRGSVRPARGIAVVLGNQVRFNSFAVEQNGFSAADTFTLTLPFFIRDNANGEKLLANGPGFSTQLLTTDIIPVQLYVGYPRNPDEFTPADLTKIMDGFMDTDRLALGMTGETMSLRGRNKVGGMIDTKVSTAKTDAGSTFPNRTASDIAREFAGQHGLEAKVQNTTERAGTYLNSYAAALGRETTQWDFLLFLAQREGFVCRVRGNTLYLAPWNVVVEDSQPIPYTYGQNIEWLEIERGPHAAKNLEVIVLSHDRNSKKVIKGIATSTTDRARTIGGNLYRTQKYRRVFAVPGLTKKQADGVAQKIYTDLSRSQMMGSMAVAGNTELLIDRKVKIDGLGDGFSAEYYINRVAHRFSADENAGGFSSELSFSSQTDYSQIEGQDVTNDGQQATAGGVRLTSNATAGNVATVLRDGRPIGAHIAQAYDSMVAAARNDGVTLKVLDGWRSFDDQVYLWNKYGRNPDRVAVPGTSNHEKGNAIDFVETPGAFSWLYANASRFGFYNYPPEPWHYSTNGH